MLRRRERRQPGGLRHGVKAWREHGVEKPYGARGARESHGRDKKSGLRPNLEESAGRRSTFGRPRSPTLHHIVSCERHQGQRHEGPGGQGSGLRRGSRDSCGETEGAGGRSFCRGNGPGGECDTDARALASGVFGWGRGRIEDVDRELRKSGDATHFATDGPAPRR